MANIILGYMDNPEGNRALDLAIDQTHQCEGRLIVVHSLRGGTHTSSEEINDSRTSLDAVGKRLTEEGLDFEIEDYVRGKSPADDILAAAADFTPSGGTFENVIHLTDRQPIELGPPSSPSTPNTPPFTNRPSAMYKCTRMASGGRSGNCSEGRGRATSTDDEYGRRVSRWRLPTLAPTPSGHQTAIITTGNP